MIQVIYGKKGSGKTKRILDMANDAGAQQNGDIVFVDDDNRYMFDLRHEVRFVNATEYDIRSADAFYGFLCGMVAQNFDLKADKAWEYLLRMIKGEKDLVADERLPIRVAERFSVRNLLEQ